MRIIALAILVSSTLCAQEPAKRATPDEINAQLNAKIAQQFREMEELRKQVLLLTREFSLHQTALFQCQDQLDSRALATPVQPQSSVAEQTKESDAKK